MADNEHKSWLEKSTPLVAWLALAGTIIVFFLHGHEFNTLNRENVAAQIEGTEADTEYRKAELEPRVVLSHEIDVPTDHPHNPSLRTIRLRMVLSNVGQKPVQIDSVGVKVSRGQLSETASDVVARANALYALERQIPWHGTMVTPQEEGELNKLWDEYNELHKNCPHGQLFIVGADASDVEWQEIVQLSKPSSATLGPQQSNEVDFDIVCTHFYNHLMWIKLEPQLVVGGKLQEMGEALVSLQGMELATNEVKTSHTTGVPQTTTRTTPYEVRYRFPMLPTGKMTINRLDASSNHEGQAP